MGSRLAINVPLVNGEMNVFLGDEVGTYLLIPKCRCVVLGRIDPPSITHSTVGQWIRERSWENGSEVLIVFETKIFARR